MYGNYFCLIQSEKYLGAWGFLQGFNFPYKIDFQKLSKF